MAGLAAIRTWLVGVIGCTDDLRDAITDDQGITDIEMLGELEEDDVRVLCNNIRKPGGLIPNPNAAVVGQAAEVATLASTYL
jgi:hypothetical protein